MNEPMQLGQFGLPAGGGEAVSIDVPCRKCGYNLRGLNAEGRCPECGVAVGFSTQGDYLQFSSPQWLETLARGARIYIWGIVVLIAGSIAVGLLLRGSGAATWVQLFAFAMLTVGWWLLTEPDPSGLGENRYGVARRLIRIGLLGSVIEQFLDSIIQLGGSPQPIVNGVMGILRLTLSVLALIAFFAQLNYLRKLALRVPSPQMAQRAGFLIKAFAITLPLMLIGAIGFGIYMAARFGGAAGPTWNAVSTLGVVLLVGLFLAMLVFGIMYLLLIEKMGTTFRNLARTARNTWAATAPGVAPAV